MWEFVINLLEVAILFLLFNTKLEKKELSYSYLLQILCLFSQAFLLLILKKFSCSTIFILLFFIGIHFLYGFLFFENKPITLLFWSVLYAVGTILADAVTTIVPTAFWDIDLSALLPNGMLRIPFTLIYISILFLFTLILLCINNQTFRLPFREKLAFILLSLLCIAILQAILIRQLTGYAPDQGNNNRFLSVIFFLVLFLFFAFVLYVYTLGTTQEQNQRLSEENIIQQMELKQYEQVVSSVEELRSVKHDMQNHMTVISAMLHEKQYEKACSYIDTYADKLNQTHRIISSVDVVHEAHTMWVTHGYAGNAVFFSRYHDWIILHDIPCIRQIHWYVLWCKNRGSHIDTHKFYCLPSVFLLIAKCKLQIFNTCQRLDGHGSFIRQPIIIHILSDAADTVSTHLTLRAVRIVHIHLEIRHLRRLDQDQSI